MAKLNLDAKQLLAEINKVVDELNRVKEASKSMASTTKSNFSAMEKNIKGIRTKVQLLANQMNLLKAILAKNTQEVNKSSNASRKNTSETDKNTRSKKRNTQEQNKNTKSYKGFNLSITNILKSAGLLKLAQQALALARNVFETTKTFDSLAFTLEKITKTALDYENSQRFLLRITKAYGVELVTTTTRWARFLAAAQESGLALRDTENIFESMTKAAGTLGLKTDELTSVYLALEQMLSKGKITTEELRRQLGERLPGAMGIMAASIGVTIPELDKMLKKGEVLSAEVLPDFAEAVERAYGIENVDRIETLISKQNRLTAAWQTFIKNLSEGDSVIKRVFGNFIDLMAETIDGWDRILRSDSQSLRVEISLYEEEFEKSLEKSTKNYVDRIQETVNQEIALNARERTLDQALKTAVGEERKLILEQLDEIARIRAEKGKQEVERNKEIAKEKVENAFKAFQEAELEFDRIFKDLEKTRTGGQVKSQFDQDDFDRARMALIRTTAQYNVFRKLVEDSNVQVLSDEEPEITQRRLRRIKDYWLETMNEISRGVADANKTIASDETIDLEVRLEAFRKVAAQETLIRQREYEIRVRDAEAKLASELASIESSVEKGTLSREKANEFIKASEKEKNDFIRLEAIKLSNDIIDLNNQISSEIGELTSTTVSDRQLASIEDIFNKQASAAKERFNQSKRTVADEEILARELEAIARDSANAIIDIKIQMLRDEIEILRASGEANDEYIAKLEQQINKLESEKIEAPIDPEEWRAVLAASLGIANDFTRAIGSIFNNIYQSRIENINAEIRAEEEKYDRLIELAEGDEEQQKTLERNREDRIKRLERERLKEEQKQAKARKKFAIANIAINTAQAIMGIWADFPKFDFGATAAIMSGVVAALGAAQIAAVLATPIPQFKDGVTNLSKNQLAMINDGSYQEFVERNGRILTTDKKNAVVDLKKGDTVYRDYDDMASRSALFKIKNASAISSHQRQKDLEDVTEAVLQGISKAKINNRLNINNTIKDDRYRESLSRWTK